MSSRTSTSSLILSALALFASTVSAIPGPTPVAAPQAAAASAAGGVVSAGSYTLGSFPAVTAAPACVASCLAPAAVASAAACGNNAPSNDCACLSQPVEAVMSVMSCASALCQSSQSLLASSASHLYTSYCAGQYLPSQIQAATIAEAPKLSSISSAMAASSASVAATRKGAAPTQGASDGLLLALGGALAAAVVL